MRVSDSIEVVNAAFAPLAKDVQSFSVTIGFSALNTQGIDVGLEFCATLRIIGHTPIFAKAIVEHAAEALRLSWNPSEKRGWRLAYERDKFAMTHGERLRGAVAHLLWREVQISELEVLHRGNAF